MAKWWENDEDDFDATEGPVEGESYANWQLEKMADEMLRADTRRELCRKCDDYGNLTGNIESLPQTDEDGNPEVDDEGNTLFVDYPEYICNKGHRWYQGEGKARGIQGKNPILFENHLQDRRRREIYTTIGTPDPSIQRGMYNRCVDTLTSALTPQGWRSHDELSEGDLIWSYQIEDDQFVWLPLQEVYVQPFEGMLNVLESQNISARTTDGHKWAVVHERAKDERVVAQSGIDLTDRHYIILPHGAFENWPESPLFELLGWVLTDGTYKPGRTDCVVYQAMHNPKVEALRSCLRANGVNDEPSMVDQNNVGRWRIQSDVGKKLRNIAPTKLISSVNLDRHFTHEYHSLLKGIIAGDGYVRELSSGYVTREIYTTKSAEADALQALATILNYASKVRRIENKAAFCPLEFAINLKNSPYAYVRPAARAQEEYAGEVWCPRVQSGFWVAQRNGTTYVTGNTHPQGRKVNTKEQRRKNGASFFR